MAAAQLRATIRGLVYVIAVVVPLVFWRGISEAFDLTKGTVLAVLGTLLLAAVGLLAIIEPRRIMSRTTAIATGVLALAAVITTVTSMDPIQSVIGQQQRYTGMVTILAGLVVVVAISAAFEVQHITRLGQVLFATLFIVVFYTFIQEAGADPWEWITASFGKAVFATLGNPNTAAGYTAIVLPFAAWLMLRMSAQPWVRMVAGAAFGAVLVAQATYNSFQGPAAATATILYVVLWAWWNGRTLGTWLIALFIALSVVVITTRVNLSRLTLAFLLVAAIFAGLGAALPTIRSWRLPPAVATRRVPLGIALGVAVLAGLLAIGPRLGRLVRDEIADGMIERGDFYRAAIGVFRDHSIVGSGIETFGYMFTQYRPASNAAVLENSRTSSVHSVQLGMFSNGGLILGLAYLLFAVLVTVVLIRALRRDHDAGAGVLWAAGAAWVAAQIQFSVSVEHVALFTVQFIVAGMVLAIGAPPGGVEHGASRGRRSSSRRALPVWVVTGVGLVAVVVAFGVMTRPMQAARASFEANVTAVGLQDVPAAVALADRATGIAPWVGQYWLERAQMVAFLGDGRQAADDAWKAIEVSRFPPGGVPLALPVLLADADAAIQVGDTREAKRRLEQVRFAAVEAVANDPHAQTLRSEMAQVLESVAARYDSLGDAAEASRVREEAAEIANNP